MDCPSSGNRPASPVLPERGKEDLDAGLPDLLGEAKTQPHQFLGLYLRLVTSSWPGSVTEPRRKFKIKASEAASIAMASSAFTVWLLPSRNSRPPATNHYRQATRCNSRKAPSSAYLVEQAGPRAIGINLSLQDLKRKCLL